MKKIVITGSNGFIGSSLVQYLYKKGYHKKYDFILIDRKDNPYGDTYSKNTMCYRVDINKDLKELKTFRDDVEIVVHLAAIPSVRESDRNIKNVIDDNILASYNIVKKCIEFWNPKRLLIASSSSVYDGREDIEMKEDFVLRLLSPYGHTKLTVEEMVQMYCNNKLLQNTTAILMRIFTCYGPRQRDELAIHAIIDSYLNDKVFTLYGDGSQRRDFTYIDDTCSAIEHLMFGSIYKEMNPQIYNIGTGTNHSINEIIALVGRLLDKNITIKHEASTIYDTMYTKAGKSRIESVTLNGEEWINKMDFVDGIKEQIKWIKNQKNI